jgi:plastocyanin
MSRVARALLVPLLLVVTVAACGGDDSGGSSSAGPGQVEVKDNQFSPKKITIAPGDTVTWTFKGSSAHNVTFDDFNSKLMKSGTFEHTFDSAGSFSYLCTVHTGMTGTVEVSDSAAP